MDPMKTPSKLFAGFSTTLLVAAALALLAGGAPANAHTPAVADTCSGIAVALTSYSATPSQPTPNTIIVTIDDEPIASERFGTSFTETYDFDDTTIGHEYVVAVDAAGTAYDRSFRGETDACALAADPADATAALTVTEPTCDEPGRLVLGEIVNATWSTPTATTGPAEYTVAAAADTGHTFADGETTLSFTGVLAGTLPSTDKACAVPIVIPPQPEPTVTSSSVDDIDCSTSQVTTTTTTVSTGWVLDANANTWVATTPVSTVEAIVRAATPVECPVAAAAERAAAPGADDIDTAPVADTLPETGSNVGWVVLIAGGLILAGIQVMLLRSTRRSRSRNQK